MAYGKSASCSPQRTNVGVVMDAAKASYAVQDLPMALAALAMIRIRSVIGELDLDQTLSSRDRINSSLLAILDGATEPWGAKVSRVEIRKIEPPENLIRAMNLQMTAERERRATVARAEGEREAEIKRAEGEKQALILSAEGRREAAMRDAAQMSMVDQPAIQPDAGHPHGETAIGTPGIGTRGIERVIGVEPLAGAQHAAVEHERLAHRVTVAMVASALLSGWLPRSRRHNA